MADISIIPNQSPFKNRKRFTPEQESEIIRRHLAGETICSLAEEFNFWEQSISIMLGRHGIKVQKGTLTPEQREEVVRRYLAGERTMGLAKEYGVCHGTIGQLIRAVGLTPRPQWGDHNRLPLRQDAFSTITPESAYWIGFLMADGSVNDKRGSVKLALAEEDIGHIEKYKLFLGSGHKIDIQSRGEWNGYIRQNLCSLRVSSKQIVSDLAKYGVGPRKSLTAKVIGLANNRDFWRGLVDGDGSVIIHNADGRQYPCIKLCGNTDILMQFRDYVQTILPTKTGIFKDSRGNSYNMSFSGRPALMIIERLYSDASVYLDRKFEMAHSFLRDFKVEGNKLIRNKFPS